ncbi:MAG TPA: energy transducer TonB [Acidobacteriota bacterium]|nr:energy transducer TonB [Acidobacteriota bacterium]
MKKLVFRLCLLSVVMCVATNSIPAIQSQKAKPNPERIPIGPEPAQMLNAPGIELAVDFREVDWALKSFDITNRGISGCQPNSLAYSHGYRSPDPNIPDFRHRIISQPKPHYTDEARKAHIVGKVVLSVEFRADGTIGNIRLLRSLGYGLDEQAIVAARQIKFHPALKNEKPMTYTSRVEFSFNLID